MIVQTLKDCELCVVLFECTVCCMVTPWYVLLVVLTIAVTSLWAQWHLISPASQLFAWPFVAAEIKENIEAPHHWPLWGESTGHRWIPLKRASNVENVSIWWRHYETNAFLFYRWVNQACMIWKNYKYYWVLYIYWWRKQTWYPSIIAVSINDIVYNYLNHSDILRLLLCCHDEVTIWKHVFGISSPLWGESISHQWIPSQRASNEECLCFHFSLLEQVVEQTCSYQWLLKKSQHLCDITGIVTTNAAAVLQQCSILIEKFVLSEYKSMYFTVLIHWLMHWDLNKMKWFDLHIPLLSMIFQWISIICFL